MKIYIIISFLCAFGLISYGQADKSDLYGQWICENNDSLYYKAKHITFYHDPMFRDRSNQCNFVQWTIEPDRLIISNVNICIDNVEGHVGSSLLQYKLHPRTGGRRTIELFKGEDLYSEFKVVEVSEKRVDNSTRTTKVLRLKRIRNRAAAGASG